MVNIVVLLLLFPWPSISTAKCVSSSAWAHVLGFLWCFRTNFPAGISIKLSLSEEIRLLMVLRSLRLNRGSLENVSLRWVRLCLDRHLNYDWLFLTNVSAHGEKSLLSVFWVSLSLLQRGRLQAGWCGMWSYLVGVSSQTKMEQCNVFQELQHPDLGLLANLSDSPLLCL